MVTLEVARAAAMADQPWKRLDELVRGELEAGRRVREVADEFDRLRDEVWDTPGLSDDGADAYGDTLDALLGNCARESRYVDIAPPTLPTEAEIAVLPRWARVAFAGRCMRRSLPQFAALLVGSRIPDDYDFESDVRRTVRTERAAALGQPGRLAYLGTDNDSPPTEHALASSTVTDATAVGHVGVAISGAAATVAVAGLGDQTVAAFRRDFDRLADLARYFGWTDDTPVPPDVFGPLWPAGPPAGWPADPDVPQRAELPLAVTARDGVAAGVLVEEVVNLFNALNRFHIARTGRRLTLPGDVHIRLGALVPAGAA